MDAAAQSKYTPLIMEAATWCAWIQYVCREGGVLEEICKEKHKGQSPHSYLT